MQRDELRANESELIEAQNEAAKECTELLSEMESMKVEWNKGHQQMEAELRASKAKQRELEAECEERRTEAQNAVAKQHALSMKNSTRVGEGAGTPEMVPIESLKAKERELEAERKASKEKEKKLTASRDKAAGKHAILLGEIKDRMQVIKAQCDADSSDSESEVEALKEEIAALKATQRDLEREREGWKSKEAPRGTSETEILDQKANRLPLDSSSSSEVDALKVRQRVLEAEREAWIAKEVEFIEAQEAAAQMCTRSLGEMEALKSDKDMWQQRMDGLEAKHQEWKEKEVKLIEARDDSAAECVQLYTEIDKLKADMDTQRQSLNAEVEALTADMDAQRQNMVEELEASKADKEAQKQIMDAEIQALKADKQKQIMDAEIQALKADKEAEKQIMDAEMQALQTEIDALRMNQRSVETEKDEWKVKEDELLKVQKEYSRLVSSMEALKNEMGAGQQELETDLNVLKAKNCQLEADRERWKAAEGEFTEARDVASKEIRRLLSLIEAMKVETEDNVQALKSELEGEHAKLRDVQMELTVTTRLMNQMEAGLLESDNERQRLDAEMQSLKATLELQAENAAERESVLEDVKRQAQVELGAAKKLEQELRKENEMCQKENQLFRKEKVVKGSQDAADGNAMKNMTAKVADLRGALAKKENERMAATEEVAKAADALRTLKAKGEKDLGQERMSRKRAEQERDEAWKKQKEAARLQEDASRREAEAEERVSQLERETEELEEAHLAEVAEMKDQLADVEKWAADMEAENSQLTRRAAGLATPASAEQVAGSAALSSKEHEAGSALNEVSLPFVGTPTRSSPSIVRFSPGTISPRGGPVGRLKRSGPPAASVPYSPGAGSESSWHSDEGDED